MQFFCHTYYDINEELDMRYRNAWMLTFALLVAACKPTAPVAEAAVTSASTQSAAAISADSPVAVDTSIAAGFTRGMPYATLRATLTDAGWLPLRDPECWDNVGGTARVCGQLPEVESCSGDGHCVMHFANADAGERIRVATYGPYERWNTPGEQAALAVQSWALSPLQAAGHVANDAAPACPSRDFETFLKAFAADQRLRHTFTAPLVKVVEIEDKGDDGYFPRTVYVEGAAYRDFNLVYDQGGFHFGDGAGKWDKQLLPLKITSPASDVSEVEYAYGTSEGNSYRFQDRSGCWYLTEDPKPPADP